MTAIVTASMHSISVFPVVKSTLFPNPNIEVLAFKSNSRLIIANNGDHELFISHVHYGSNSLDYADIAKELLSIVYDKPKHNVKVEESHLLDSFDTNQDIGIIVKPGQVIKHKFEINIPQNLSFVHGKSKKEWDQLVFIAEINKKSSVIRAIFFSPNDSRYKQLQRAFKDGLNTFPGEGTIYAYSPILKKNITFPFKLFGTVVISHEDEFKSRLNRWLNPRRGHPEDLQ